VAEFAGGLGLFGGADVEFQIAGYDDAIWAAADCYQAVGVSLGLGEDSINAAEKGTPETAKEAVTRPGAVRDAGVDHGDGDLPAAAGAEQVGPELSFSQDEEAGAEGAKPGADGPGQIERTIENAFSAKALASEFLPGTGGGGDDDEVGGEGGLKRADEAGDGENFTDRYGVNPDDGVSLAEAGENGAAHEAEPLQHTLAVFVGGGHLPEPEGRAEDEGGKEGQVVEKQNHT